MKILIHRKFEKKYVKMPAKIQQAFKERRNLFLQSPLHPKLNNHALQGKWAGYRSINITGNFRAVFKQIDNLFIFVDIDTHSNLYK